MFMVRLLFEETPEKENFNFYCTECFKGFW